MSEPEPTPFTTLLPVPRESHRHPGSCHVAADRPVAVQADDPRTERAVRSWCSSLVGDGRRSSSHKSAGTIRVAVDPAVAKHSDGFRLTVRRDGVDLLGASSAGCFHGLQTLAQLAADGGEVPCCTVVDWPDFTTRGLLLDVSRGRVPTLDTLETLVDRLAMLKINQLQVYIEHAFAFGFDPQICGPDEGLTPDDVRKLDAYCRERFINLVPALATPGHMGRILSIPRYRHLAEVESTKPWEKMSWLERMRGFTLDIMNPESHALVARMWTELLDAFSSPVVNLCGDEPWDLGKGKNRERFEAGGSGEPYLEHIRRVHDICAARGRRTQIWSDVLRNHPHLLERLPRDVTVLHWGYDDRTDYEGTSEFVRTGLDTFVCPGTSGWKRILNAMELAERNIAAFAAAGHKHGASGLLNTDWGDHGHFNALACSWHGIALGACLGWNVEHPTGTAFDERFAPAVLGIEDASVVRLLRDASRWADDCETWRIMWQPLAEVCTDPTLPTIEEAVRAAEAAGGARKRLEGIMATDPVRAQDYRELALACRFTQLFAVKVRLARDRRPQAAGSDGPDIPEAWSRQLADAASQYADAWQARNKPSGLRDILTALSAIGGLP